MARTPRLTLGSTRSDRVRTELVHAHTQAGSSALARLRLPAGSGPRPPAARYAFVTYEGAQVTYEGRPVVIRIR